MAEVKASAASDVPVELKAKVQDMVDEDIVRKMTMDRDVPRELLLQQKILGQTGFIECFNCNGSGKVNTDGISQQELPGCAPIRSNTRPRIQVAAVWLYEKQPGSWGVFERGMAAQLEAAFNEGSGAMLNVSSAIFEYMVDLDEMTQTNTKTGTVRKVWRLSDDDLAVEGNVQSAWFVFCNETEDWQPCLQAGMLETAWRQHLEAATTDPIIRSRAADGLLYEYDMVNMTQTDITMGKVQQLRRQVPDSTWISGVEESNAIDNETNQPPPELEHLLPKSQPSLQRIATDQVLPGGVCWVCRGSGQTSKWLLEFNAQEVEREVPDCTVCYASEAEYGISTTCGHYYCGDCIRMSLEAMMDTGQFPAICPMCRAEAGGKECEVGRIAGTSLTFLQQRGVITKAFQFRFLKQQNKALQIAEPDFLECPAKCGEFFLLSDPSYMAQPGETYFSRGDVAVQLGSCPSCKVRVCTKCEKSIPGDAPHKCEDIKAKLGADDLASLEFLAKIGKKCPACGMFIQKTEGCDIMMCGTTAHGKVADALRNGGCAFIFSWNRLEACDDGHGYTDINGKWVRGKGPVTDRQVLLGKGGVAAGGPAQGFGGHGLRWTNPHDANKRVVILGNSEGCACLPGRCGGLRIDPNIEIPAALLEKGLSRENWKNWLTQLREIHNKKAKACDCFRCLFCFILLNPLLYAIFFLHLFLGCPCYWIHWSKYDPFQVAARQWLCDFNEHMEPLGIYATLQCHKQTGPGGGHHNDNTLAVLILAIDEEEIKRLKAESPLQMGHCNDPNWACWCCNAHKDRIV